MSTPDEGFTVMGCEDCGVRRGHPHRVTCKHWGTGERVSYRDGRVGRGPSPSQCRWWRPAVDPTVMAVLNGTTHTLDGRNRARLAKAVREVTA